MMQNLAVRYFESERRHLEEQRPQAELIAERSVEFAQLMGAWRAGGHAGFEIQSKPTRIEVKNVIDPETFETKVGSLHILQVGAISEGRALAHDEYRLFLPSDRGLSHNFSLIARVISSDPSSWDLEFFSGVTRIYSNRLDRSGADLSKLPKGALNCLEAFVASTQEMLFNLPMPLPAQPLPAQPI